MLAEFEQRLADVLGTRLDVPWKGSVDVVPGREEARVVLSIRHSVPLEQDLLSIRPEVVPGSSQQRRVLRLRCEVRLDFRILQGESRADQMHLFDAVAYELDDPSFRSGAALQLNDGADPGFQVCMFLISVDPPASLVLAAEGLFWPAGVQGRTGIPISAAQVRLSVQPLGLAPPRPRLIAGGEGVILIVDLGETGALKVESGGRIAALPFGSVVVSVVDAGGRPGAGLLAGGAIGAGKTLLLPVTASRVTFRYTPSAQATTDFLVVALDNGEGGVGIELGRFPLKVLDAA